MAYIKAKFYQLDKRVRSTKRPADTDESTDYNIVFKRPTNIMNPDILIDTNGVYPDFTYCIIQIPLDDEGEEVVTKDLYYFVESITVAANERFEFHLKLDTLATTKDTILAATAFVIYSSSDYNRWMRDERVPIVIKDSEIIGGSSSIISSSYDVPVFDSSATNETVILTAISASKGLLNYVIDEDILDDIAASLAGTDISQFLDDLEQQFGDAVGSIVQVRRLPVSADALNKTTLGTIYLGAYEVKDRNGDAIPATYLNTPMVGATGSISIPLTYTDFRWTEPYCVAKMSLPFVGVVDIAITDFPGGVIYWKMILDAVNGTVMYTLYNSNTDEKPQATFSGECGMLIPIASAQISNTGSIVTSAASGSVGLAAAAVSGNPIALAGGIVGITSAFSALLQKSTSVIGSYSGGRAEFFNTKIRIIVEKYATGIEPTDLTDIEGRPSCKVTSLAALTGFVRTNGFQLGGSWFKEIKDEVNALLDSGIYIE